MVTVGMSQFFVHAWSGDERTGSSSLRDGSTFQRAGSVCWSSSLETSAAQRIVPTIEGKEVKCDDTKIE